MKKQPLHIKGEIDGIIYNELLPPYESWADYVFWHEPWIYATNDHVIDHTALENGNVVNYRIEWAFAKICADMEKQSLGLCNLRQPLVISLIRLNAWWKKIGIFSLKKWKRGGL